MPQSAVGSQSWAPKNFPSVSAPRLDWARIRLNPLVKREPVLLVEVEVLSPSTAAYDRGEKFAHYRSIPSLAEYVLVDLDTRRVDVYRKGADGLWVLHPFAAGETVHWASVNLTVSAETLFAEVDEPVVAAPSGDAA